MSRIAAFFDIDGTIYREGLITEVFKKIIKYELVDKEKWENEVRPAYISWDKRQGDYEDECRMFIKRQHENKTKEQPWCTSENFHPEECNTNEL